MRLILLPAVCVQAIHLLRRSRWFQRKYADPVGREFAITFDEINYGLEVEDALYNFGERIHSEEVQYFITAVVIQKVTGGNLADVLNRIAEVMRSRVKTYREVDIQASEMRLSANVLIGLPFFVAGAVAIT